MIKDDVPLAELMYLVFTCMPGESYCRRFGSLLLVCAMSFERLLTPLCVDSNRCGFQRG